VRWRGDRRPYSKRSAGNPRPERVRGREGERERDRAGEKERGRQTENVPTPSPSRAASSPNRVLHKIFQIAFCTKRTAGSTRSGAQETPDPQPQAQTSKLQTLNAGPSTPHPTPHTPNPKSQTPNPKPQTPNPKPQTSNSKFQSINPKPTIRVGRTDARVGRECESGWKGERVWGSVFGFRVHGLRFGSKSRALNTEPIS
jgi:hypothetical protein